MFDIFKIKRAAKRFLKPRKNIQNNLKLNKTSVSGKKLMWTYSHRTIEISCKTSLRK